eukprot:802471-Prorocentrum_minimum.AAC.3
MTKPLRWDPGKPPSPPREPLQDPLQDPLRGSRQALREGCLGPESELSALNPTNLSRWLEGLPAPAQAGGGPGGGARGGGSVSELSLIHI